MPDELIAFGSEIKALGEGKLGGYLVRFSDPNTPDVVGDYFDASTKFHLPDSLPLLYNHGLDSTLKARVIGNGRAKIDEVGIWLDAQMDMRDEYEKAIDQMAEAGKLGYSSQSAKAITSRHGLSGKHPSPRPPQNRATR